ncbi:MAG TPA: TetR/AcrR family transcriptional regulator [Terriglobales bacterium]|nr:TetR/AcrR family transcriptional regulator [Terriglobales bacterium]
MNSSDQRRRRPALQAYHHGALRAAALTEARRILARKGADAVTLRAIARSVGVTANALYRHFQNKDALLGALAEEGFRELSQRFQSIAERDPQARFIEMARQYVGFGIAKPALLQVMFGRAMARLSKNSSLGSAAKEAFLELLRGAADAAGLPLETTDSFQLAIACWSLVHGYATLATNGALDSLTIGKRPDIRALARFIELNPKQWPTISASPRTK